MQESFVKNHTQLDIEVYYILSPIFFLLYVILSWADLLAFFAIESSYYSQDTTENHQPYTEGCMAASDLEKVGYLYPN